MKLLIIVLITFSFSIIAQASIPNYHPGVIHEINILEEGLNPSILL